MSDLSSRGSRGGLVSIGGRLVTVTARLATVVILARLISPETFGVIALAMAIVELAVAVIDFGLPLAVAQSVGLGHRARSSLFLINAALGIAIGAALAGLGGILAELYQLPELEQIVYALAVVPVVAGLAAQYRANLMSNLRFVSLSAIETLSRLASMVAAVIVAALGDGVVALIVLSLTAPLLELPALVLTSRWFPGLPGDWLDVRRVLAIGSQIFGLNLIRSATRTVLVPVAGLVVPIYEVGQLDRANQLATTPTSAFSDALERVSVPILSRVREDSDRLISAFDRLHTMIVVTLGSAIGVTAALGTPLLSIVLGDEWELAATLFQLLALTAMFRLFAQAVQWYLIASDNTAVGLRMSLWSQPLIVALAIGGLYFGVQGMVAAYFVGTALYWPLATWIAARASRTTPWRMLRGPLAALSLIVAPATLIAYLARTVMPTNLTQVFVGVGAAATAVFLMIIASRRARLLVRESVKLISAAFRRRSL